MPSVLHFPAWTGVGGNPQSVTRAARLGFSLALAIIGGPPARFAAYSQLFQRALEKFGRPPLPVGIRSPGHVADTDEQAKAEFWPRWREIIALMRSAGPVMPAGRDVALLPGRRCRPGIYPGGSGLPGGSGTSQGPRSSRGALSSRLFPRFG